LKGIDYFKYLFLILFLTFLGCNSSKKKESKKPELKKITVSPTNTQDSVKTNIETVDYTAITKVIVVQCANGYEYSQHGYDFNYIIERELNKFKNVQVKPFPLKALLGVSYQGVFDKKYCTPIIEKVDVDFLILTRFDKQLDILNRDKMKWGYELRIINTKTLNQINSISLHNAIKYEQIGKHIKDNIGILKADIEKMK
jgi:hypothetical protein